MLSAAAPAPARAVPPRPGIYDPKTGTSTATDRPLPEFPDWFGKGLRPLKATSDEERIVALLVDFPDRQANTVARSDSFFRELLLSQGVHPTGSFRDFYNEQSYGTFDVTGGVYGWFRTEEEYSVTFDDDYYGFAGGGRGVFVAAVLLADPTVDFGLYDSDGADGIPNSGDDDGYVDACLIFHSGPGGHDTMNPSDIWAYASVIEPPIETNDPRSGGGFILVASYSMQPEFTFSVTGDTLASCISVVAHEYGHHLGLRDLYDGSQSWGIGYWGLMGLGAFGSLRTGPYHMSAWSKVQLGWITPIVVTENMLDIMLPPVETEPVAYKVWRDGSTPEKEYFLLENRQNIGFDTFLPGHGLLIWHIDEPMLGSRPSRQAAQETTEGWYFVALEQADGLNDLATRFDRPDKHAHYPEIGGGADPFPGDSLNTCFDGYSNPSSHDNSGLPTEVSIVDIALEGDNIRLSIVTDSSTVAVYFRGFLAKVRDSSVELTWDVTADETIDGFRLYRAQVRSGPDISITGNGLISRESRRYVDRDVRPGEIYRYVLGAVRPDGSELRSHPIEASMRAAALVLRQNFPNPFNPATAISYFLPEGVWVNLSIFDVKGRLVSTLEDGALPAGPGKIEWDGRDDRGSPVTSGVYFYRLKAGKQVLVKKMVFIE